VALQLGHSLEGLEDGLQGAADAPEATVAGQQFAGQRGESGGRLEKIVFPLQPAARQARASLNQIAAIRPETRKAEAADQALLLQLLEGGFQLGIDGIGERWLMQQQQIHRFHAELAEAGVQAAAGMSGGEIARHHAAAVEAPGERPERRKAAKQAPEATLPARSCRRRCRLTKAEFGGQRELAPMKAQQGSQFGLCQAETIETSHIEMADAVLHSSGQEPLAIGCIGQAQQAGAAETER
jgi:hypothetical protein